LDPAGGTYSAPQTPEVDLRGLLQGGDRGREERKGMETGEGKRGKWRGGEGSLQVLLLTVH